MFNKDAFHEGLPTELALFDLPVTQTAVTDIYQEHIRSSSQLSDDSPIEFKISGQNSMDYLDLKGSEIYVKVRVTKADGSSLGSGEKVAPVNLWLQALFATVEITLQNKATVTSTYNPYKSIIQVLLNNGADCKQTQLTSQLFYRDDEDHPEDPGE